MKRAVCLFASVLLASALPWAYGQAGNPADLQQKLNATFKITILAANHSDIATPGDVVELHKAGMRLSALSAVLTESNTYKDGKIGGGGAKRGWGSFGTAMMQASAALDTSGETAAPTTGPPPHILAAGDKCWILSITVQKDAVQFKLYTDPDANGIRYRGDLKFPFPDKKQVPTADAMLATIAEVMSVVPSGDQGAQQPPAQGDAGQSAYVLGKYIDNRTKTDYVELGPGGVFTLFQRGKTYGGIYTIAGDTVICTGPRIRGLVKLNIVGNTLTYQDGTVYEKQGDATPVQDLAAAPAPPAPAARQYDEVAPPPPPPAPAPTITIGERKTQVDADFGEPQRKAVIGQKEIYFYTDLKMKITFVNGKVSSIE
jgi:hypothetical protein